MCTGATISSNQGNYYWARTMDFAIDFFNSGGELLYFPKDVELSMKSGNIHSKYLFYGMGLPNSYFLTDGINNAGLTGGCFYFEEATCASEESLIKKNKVPVVMDELVAIFLAQCATVEEVAFLASKLAVINESTKNKMLDLEGILPLHQMFTDASGKSIILEAISNGELKIYENTTGTIANSPTYDWHLTNLRNYVNLSDYTKSLLELDNLKIKDIESGSGLHGLPGDYTSPSRYIKITLLSKMMTQPDDESALNDLYNVFCAVIIPKGIEKDSPTRSDYTAYWAGYDISKRELQLKPTATETFTKVSLDSLRAKFGSQVGSIKINLEENLQHEI